MHPFDTSELNCMRYRRIWNGVLTGSVCLKECSVVPNEHLEMQKGEFEDLKPVWHAQHNSCAKGEPSSLCTAKEA